MSGSAFIAKTRFLDPEKILFATGLKTGQTVADLGAGSGFYAVASGRIVGDNGRVFVVDIVEQVLSHVVSEARLNRVKNITTIRSDLEGNDALAGIPQGQTDLVIFANILHQVKAKQKLMSDAYALLKTQGRVLVVEWNREQSAIGPSFEERVSEEDMIAYAQKSNLKFLKEIDTDKYHYGLLFEK